MLLVNTAQVAVTSGATSVTLASMLNSGTAYSVTVQTDQLERLAALPMARALPKLGLVRHPWHAIRIVACETRVTVRVMGNPARTTYVRYRTECALPANLWSPSGLICCLSRQRWLR